jgi:hypothetical protein
MHYIGCCVSAYEWCRSVQKTLLFQKFLLVPKLHVIMKQNVIFVYITLDATIIISNFQIHIS